MSYIHTIAGRPATFDPTEGCLVFVTNGETAQTVNTMQEVRAHRRASNTLHKQLGLIQRKDYGLIKVSYT